MRSRRSFQTYTALGILSLVLVVRAAAQSAPQSTEGIDSCNLQYSPNGRVRI